MNDGIAYCASNYLGAKKKIKHIEFLLKSISKPRISHIHVHDIKYNMGKRH